MSLGKQRSAIYCSDGIRRFLIATIPFLFLEAILCVYAYGDLLFDLPPTALPLVLIAGITAVAIFLFDDANLSNSEVIPDYKERRYSKTKFVKSDHLGRREISELLKNASEKNFERFCTYLLRAEGCVVEHARCSSLEQEVDLIARDSNGEHNLIKCNCAKVRSKIDESDLWRIRGDMAYMEILKGAIYTANGWTRRSIRYAQAHKIELVNLQSLVERAERVFSSGELRQIITTGQTTPPIPIGEIKRL
ncbi:MAG: restriction endonuclease [Verrucomicrobiota bacterium]